MTYHVQFLLLVVAGWVNRQQQDVVDYQQEENRVLRGGLRGKRLRLSDDDRRRLAVKAQALGRDVLAQIASVATPATLLRWYRYLIAAPSTMAARTGAQADLPRRRTSVSSWYAWRGRTRRGDIRACRAHSRTLDMNSDATPSRGSSPSTVSRLPRSEARACRGAPSSRVIVYRSGLTKGTGVLSGARRIDVTMSITRIPL